MLDGSVVNMNNGDEISHHATLYLENNEAQTSSTDTEGRHIPHRSRGAQRASAPRHG